MSDAQETSRPLSQGDLFELKRRNTPPIYNRWEQVTKRNPAKDGIYIEEAQYRVDGFVSIGNGTGICDTGGNQRRL